MSRDLWLGVGLGLVVGGLAGYTVGSYVGSTSVPAPPPASPAAPQPGDPAARIAANELEVRRNPGHVEAWVALGNDYFDTHQAQKSVDAYGKALALKPDQPGVITDQGVMYRELGQFDKAVANFERAQALDPNHVQSLFNLGVVYAHDLKQPDRARRAWTALLQKFPTAPQAAQARQGLEELKAASGK